MDFESSFMAQMGGRLTPSGLADPLSLLGGMGGLSGGHLGELTPRHPTALRSSVLDAEAFIPLAKNTAKTKRKPDRQTGDGGANTFKAKGNIIYKALGGDDRITVRKSNNTIIAGGGDDFINAQKSKGDNVLKGGGGDDEIIGGGRGDLLVGGGGADLLVIADGKLNQGVSIIKGFKKSDAIAIRNVKKADEFDDLTFKKAGKDTLIRVGKRDIALVQKTKPKVLKQRADDFVFGASEEPGDNSGGGTGGNSGGGSGSGSGETLPILSIGDRAITEGDSGTTTATFTVSLSQAATKTVTVAYATTANTATAGSDYTNSTGTLTFTPGTTTQSITVPIIGDTVDEANETFLVSLSNPSQATLGDGQAIGTIVDNDGAIQLPTLSISGTTLIEGNGKSTATFTVTLNQPFTTPVTVDYATADDTAIAGDDYTATSGTLTFAANTTSQTITVPVIGDDIEEGNETFSVTLSNPTSATLATGQAKGSILNDDVAPEFRDKRTGKVIEKPSAQPDLDFEIFDTLIMGQVIEDGDDSDSVGVFENAIEDFRFNTQGFSLDPIWSGLEFAQGTLTATRNRNNTITYLFSSNALDVLLQEEGASDVEVIQDNTISGDAIVLTVDLTSGSSRPVPRGFDAVRAVNDLDYIIDANPFKYAINGTAYAGTSVTDISFFPNICPPPGSGLSDVDCEDLTEDVA